VGRACPIKKQRSFREEGEGKKRGKVKKKKKLAIGGYEQDVGLWSAAKDVGCTGPAAANTAQQAKEKKLQRRGSKP